MAAQEAYKSCNKTKGTTSKSQTLIIDQTTKKGWILGGDTNSACFTAKPDANGPVGNFSVDSSTKPADGSSSITPAPVDATSTKSNKLSIYEDGGYAQNAGDPTSIPSGGIAIQKGNMQSVSKVKSIFVWDGKNPANCGGGATDPTTATIVPSSSAK
jgi:hypothetical protein